MAAILKHKYMPRTALNEDFALPTPNQQIARMMGTKGSQLHEVRSIDGTIFLVSLPAKWRKRTWVKRGDFVFVELIQEGKKVQGQVVNVLTRDHIVFLHQQGLWPEAFTPKERISARYTHEDLCRNPNRPVVSEVETSDSDDECSSEEESSTSEEQSEDDDCSSDFDLLNSHIKDLNC